MFEVYMQPQDKLSQFRSFSQLEDEEDEKDIDHLIHIGAQLF